MDRDNFIRLVEEANLAPSVHNTQPTRWRLEEDGSVLVLEDSTRRLAVGDPLGRDAAVSHGAAMEGFSLACAAQGLTVTQAPASEAAVAGLRRVARLVIAGGAAPDSLTPFVRTRRTYRGAFVKGGVGAIDALGGRPDATLVQAADGIACLAQWNDEAGLRTFRDGAFRAELLSWMRLSRRNPRWSQDGLNAEAMEMSGLEAAGAGLVLKPGVFEALDSLGIARLFVAEAATVRSAQAIVLFHRPDGEDPLETGRHFYRLWLKFAQAGLSAAPMAVLADDVATRQAIHQQFHLPAGRRLITAFRVGVAPRKERGPKPRLPVPSLIV